MLNAKPTLLLLVTTLVAACGGTAPTPPPSPVVVPEPTVVPGGPSAAASAGALVRLETRGGECPDGPCGTTVVINRDGTVDRSDGMAQRVDPATMDRLTELVTGTDWDAVLAVPFTGECPVNFDGQEQVYTFTFEGQTIVVASCSVLVDPATEPFNTVQGILLGSGG